MKQKYSLFELKRAYEKARADGSAGFSFHGKLFLTDFAKYMIQYLEGVYKQKGIKEDKQMIVFTDGVDGNEKRNKV